MKAMPEEIKKYFDGLAEKPVKPFSITGLASPDGKAWIGKQLDPGGGHTQGIACLGNNLVITNNQKVGPGYIALCERTSNGNYEYVTHAEFSDPDKRKTMYYHPGGIQMFEHDGKPWVVVPFETGGDKVRGTPFDGQNTYFKESEIRFYCIEGNKLEYIEKITIKREAIKAGSAGITRTDDPDKPFVLAVAYKDNAVDFYRGGMENGFTDPCLTLPASDERPSYVNAMSLLSSGNDVYLVGLSGEDLECFDLVYVSKIGFSDKSAVTDGSLYISLDSKIRSKWHGPGFRWGGSLSLSGAKLSVVAAERMIHPEKGTKTKGKTKIAVLE